MNFIFKLCNEGGSIFMYPILISLLFMLSLIIASFINKKIYHKAAHIIKHLSLIILVWGLTGQMIGLIEGLDAIEQASKVDTWILAGGIKTTLLSPLFASLTFVLSRFGLFILTLYYKDFKEI